MKFDPLRTYDGTAYRALCAQHNSDVHQANLSPYTMEPQQPAEEERLDRLLCWLFGLFGMLYGTTLIALLASGLLLFGLYALLCLVSIGAMWWARAVLRRGNASQASMMAGATLLIVALIGSLISSGTLAVLVLLPLAAAIIPLPYLSTHRMQRLLLLVALTYAALVALSLTNPLVLPETETTSWPFVVSVATVACFLLLLVYAYHQQYIRLCRQVYDAHSRIQHMQVHLEAQAETRTTAVHLNEERYRMVSEMTSDFIYSLVCDSDQCFRFEWMTESFSHLVGYTSAELAADAAYPNGLWYRILHPDDRAVFHEHLIAALRNEHEPCELRLRTRNGQERWIRHAFCSKHDDQGQMVHLLGAAQDITEHRVAEAALRAALDWFTKTFQSSPAAMSIFSLDQGSFFEVNESFLHFIGYTYDDIIGNTVTELQLWVRPSDLMQMLEAVRSGQHVRNQVHELRIASGEIRSVSLSAEVIELDDSLCVLAALYDITEQLQIEQHIRTSEERFRTLFEHSPDAIFVETLEGMVLDVNAAACHLHGYSRAELIGANCITGAIAPLHQRKPGVPQSVPSYNGTIDAYQGFARTRDGRHIPIEVRISHITYAQTPALLLHVRDVSEREAASRELSRLANYDILTRLPNRHLLRRRLQQMVWRDQQAGLYRTAVIVLDVNYFKSINDSLGHPVGDQLLITVARRLHSCVEETDTVARVGGDEFAVLLEQIGDVHEAEALAEHIQQVLKLPVIIEDHKIFPSASIGIAYNAPRYNNPEDLLRDASTAMYFVKELKRSHPLVFDEHMSQRAQGRMRVRTELPRAIERNELCVHYQPIVHLRTGKIAGFEALVRWQHPELGLLGPHTFIPVAEETDLIVPLGHWIINEVCRQARDWHAQGFMNRPVSININLSVAEFRDPNLIETVSAALRAGDMGLCQIKLEITESVMMDEADHAIDTLCHLRALGPHICIDDFGTGYSSMRYLQQFPAQTLKVDRTFVHTMCERSESLHIIKAIVLMAHAMDMDVVAEWVETEEQATNLEMMGCEYGQGYLFSRPIDSQAAGEMLRDANHLLPRQAPV